MFKRIRIYFQEMYPPVSRLFVSLLIFLQVYFLLLLNYGVNQFTIDRRELIGVITIFVFLLLLRIADDFKDYRTDQVNFPERSLPSGKVHKKDLILVICVSIGIVFALNLLYMHNIFWFLFLFTYGALMSVWFFQRHRIQPNLILALVTHNPVQFVLNFYVISFVAEKYNLPLLSWQSILVSFTMYFPVLFWEVSRKIRAPEEETQYNTYSKVMGVGRSVRLVVIAVLLDFITNVILLWRINLPFALLLLVNTTYQIIRSIQFVRSPGRLDYGKMMEGYIYRTEVSVVLGIATHLIYLQVSA
ncbi:MAG: UbiA family prenyltransferase [Fastidiosipilaceae bacterium]|jgi:4-hydroxybenzoate polyprenyltransferase